MVELLARVQFASVALTHAVFLSISLGGAIVLLVLQTSATRRGDEHLMGLVRWWGGLYVVNYVVGIGAGMLLELQLGLGFPGLVERAGNVVGASFAIETLTTFVVESTALAAWVFGFGILSRRVHLALLWVVASTALLSVFWALLANGFLQRPQGYAVREDQIVLSDPWAVLSGSELWIALGHVSAAALTSAGFAMAGTAAWWLRRATREDSPAMSQAAAFVRSARIGLLTGGAGALAAVVLGIATLSYLGEVQPAKRGALLAPGNDPTLVAELGALYGPGSWTPPGWILVPFLAMVVIGLGLLALSVSALSGDLADLADLADLDDLDDLDDPSGHQAVAPGPAPGATAVRIPFSYRMAKVLMWAAPLPLLAIVCGWLVREVGRQPWVVTGLLTTADAASGRSLGAAVAMSVFVLVVCGALLVLDVWLLSGMVRRTYERHDSAEEPGEPAGELAGGATLLDAHPERPHAEAG